MVVCVLKRDKGQVVGSKVVVASTQATVVAAVEQVTQKRIQVQLCCCVTRNEEDTRNSTLSRMGLSSFFNISDSEHNPVHIHYYTLLNPSLLLPIIQTFPTLHSNRAKHQKCLGLAFSNRPWTHYQDALSSWLAGTTIPHSITGQDWGGGKTSMTAAQAHNAPPSPQPCPPQKPRSVKAKPGGELRSLRNPSVRLPYSTLHPWPRESCIASSSALAEGLVALQKAGEGRSTVAAGRVGARPWRFTDALER